MKIITVSILWIIVLMLVLLGCSEKEQSKNTVDEVKSEHLVNVRHVNTVMTIEAINLEERLFTLRYAEGNTIVLKADPKIPDIEKIKIGDEVEVKYIKSLVVFVTSPDSSRPPISEKKTVRAEIEDGKPAEYIIDVIEKVSTVMAIDHEKREAILKDSEGHLHEVDIHDQVDNIESVSVGDQIIYHSTETIAVHLVKV
jgi:hypothetical protein